MYYTSLCGTSYVIYSRVWVQTSFLFFFFWSPESLIPNNVFRSHRWMKTIRQWHKIGIKWFLSNPCHIYLNMEILYGCFDHFPHFCGIISGMLSKPQGLRSDFSVVDLGNGSTSLGFGQNTSRLDLCTFCFIVVRHASVLSLFSSMLLFNQGASAVGGSIEGSDYFYWVD